MKSILKLKEFRTKNKMTQADVAKKLNITQAAYSMWETGHRTPKPEEILHLCKIFNCTPNDLFGIKGAMSVAFDQFFD